MPGGGIDLIGPIGEICPEEVQRLELLFQIHLSQRKMCRHQPRPPREQSRHCRADASTPTIQTTCSEVCCSTHQCHPLSHPLPAPARVYRQAHAHEHHRPTADAHGAAGEKQPGPSATCVVRRILGASPPSGLSSVGKAVKGGAEAAPINQSNELIAVSEFISRDGVKLLKEGRKFNGYYVPNNFKINAKIAMNQLIAHGNNLSPRNLWIGQSKRIWHTSCGFSDQLDVAQNGVLNQLVGSQQRLACLSKTDASLVRPSLQMAMASASTRCRNSSRNAFSVTRSTWRPSRSSRKTCRP
jgi:hypothetical protein